MVMGPSCVSCGATHETIASLQISDCDEMLYVAVNPQAGVAATGALALKTRCQTTDVECAQVLQQGK